MLARIASSVRASHSRAESGFRHIGPQHYQPRLLHFHGTKQSIEIRERPLNKHCLDSTDVFILDLGYKAFQVRDTIGVDMFIDIVHAVEWIRS